MNYIINPSLFYWSRADGGIKKIKIELKQSENEMKDFDDITYCLNADCPYKDCERNAERLKGQHGIASFANFGGVCRKYLYYLIESKSENLYLGGD